MIQRISYSMVLIAAVLAMAGCESEPEQSQLPSLSLAGPVMLSNNAAVPASARVWRGPASPHALTPLATSTPRQVADTGIPHSWLPQATANHWMWIIIHHSDSDYGSAAVIDKWHRDRGFDELGYHFVIGNGTNSGDGQIEVGPRWVKQKWGAHDNALDNRYNTNGIGICLVGNFNKTHPTAAQRRSLIRLVVYLMKTYHIPASRVLGHGETKDTQCPGRFLRASEIRGAAAEILAQGPDAAEAAAEGR